MADRKGPPAFSFQIDEELRDQLKILSIERRTTMNEIVIDLIERELAKTKAQR
jgi:hypothetical protein